MLARVITILRELPTETRRALARRDTFTVFAAVTLLYLGAFLWAIGDLFIDTGLDTSLLVVEDPLSRMFEPGPGTYTFEGIAMASGGVFLLIISPINIAIGGFLAVLVGLNMALVFEILRRPKRCGLETGTAMFSSVPALLAGSACCAPAIFLALGITATGTLLSVFELLLPLGVVLLISSLIYVGDKLVPKEI